jgi:hypothetical protein
MNEKMKKVSKYVVSSAMLVNMLAAPAAVFAADKKMEPSVVQAAVKELLEKGIMTGDQKGDMNLEGKLTRIQVASILARALKLELSQPTVSYTDVSSDSWGLKYIDSMTKLGVMAGSDGQFRPNALISKEELAVILVRITQTNIIGKGNNLPIEDGNEVSSWAKAYVDAAIGAGLMQAVDGKFSPKAKVTRQEIALLTNTFIHSEKFEQVKDSIGHLLETGKKVSNSDPTL